MHIILLFIVKYLYLIVILVAGLYWLTVPRDEKLRVAVFGIVCALVSLALVKLGATFFYDPRPFVNHAVTPLYPHKADNGFPSDHTVLTAFIALTIYSSSKRLGLFLLALAILIGVGRVIGNIHSPIDILGSLIFALIGAVTAHRLTPPLFSKLKPLFRIV